MFDLCDEKIQRPKTRIELFFPELKTKNKIKPV